MDIGTVMSAAQTLFAALQCEELKETFLGYKSQLGDLQHTVSTVKAVLRDAETKEELNHEAQHYIEQLKEVVYDADDLFDKFVTLTLQKQHLEGEKASKKVGRFFSRHNPVGIAFNMSQGVKKIRNKLDTVAKNHEKFGFSIDPKPIRQRREETCSYVYEDNIIGREDDVEKIVGHLLKDAKQDVSFLTIVGMGGLGKTALAQLVFNDARIKNAFPLRIWTCVSDNDQDSLDVEQIFRKILDYSKDKGSTKELLQRQVRAKLTSEKYLLVLDDVWTENRNQWLKLEEYLLGGQKGSWIMLTTRSLKTAKIIGNAPITYELQGLSEEKSWCLFEKIAFGSEQSNFQNDLVELGQEIVKGCARVPLAIRVAASLLYGQDKSKWTSFQKMGLSNFTESQRDIMPILKLSYNQLESPLKSCFTYCAVFPKDFDIDKATLKSLWMAQGYVVPLDDGQTMEDAAEDYFSTLLRRCFFQDAEYNGFGEVVSCKIHDLMHDIAQDVAGKEICITNVVSKNVERKVRHLSHIPTESGQYSFSKTQVRSFLNFPESFQRSKMDISTIEALVANWKSLRALDLNGIHVNISPLGELLHLRYLTISNNDLLELFPKSFTKLFNLQTLRLEECENLKELPKDFEKLVNLRFLHIRDCGIKQLTSLGNLPHLNILMLEYLEELEYIFETGRIAASMTTSTPQGCLSAEGLLSFPSLEMLTFNYLPQFKGWSNDQLHDVDINSSSSMTPALLPRLKSIRILICQEMVSNLLCPKLELGELDCLHKSLQINRLSNVIPSSPRCSYGVPKLRKLKIDSLGWLNKMPMETFQHLRELVIHNDDEPETLGEAWEVFRSCSSSLVSLRIEFCHKLRSLYCQGLEHLTALETLKIVCCDRVSLTEDEREDGTSMPWPSLVHFSRLRHLSLFRVKLVNLPNWIQFLSNLETLEVYSCEGLESVPDWMPKLTSLKKLRLRGCSRSLRERCRNPTGEDWPLIQHISSIEIP